MAARTVVPPAIVPGVDRLDVEQCRHLLRITDVGRIAVRSGDGVDVFPVNYLVHDDRIYFRSAPGSKMRLLAQSPEVAFEIDGRRGRRAWSVVVHGSARRLTDDAEIRSSSVLGLAALHPSEKNNFVEIAPDELSGREFAVRRRWAVGPLVIAGGVIALAVVIASAVLSLLLPH